jgi:carbamoyltransferase
MISWGINALNHGNSLAVFHNDKLISNVSGVSDELDIATISDALHQGMPNRIFWYERPWLKKARQLYAGQYYRAFDLSVLPYRYLTRERLHYAPVTYTPHHGSHAAAGYYSSPFDRCVVVVLDAIGEFECATIWNCSQGEMKKVWSRSYPNSLGLFYSAFTDLLGMTPIKDEYQLQQISAKGDPTRYRDRIRSYFDGIVELNYNFHRGVEFWDDPIENDQDRYDIAAAVQLVFEEQIQMVMSQAKALTGAECLVYMGGCAMNSAANKKVVEPKFKYIWSLPNPGDPSSSIGAVLYHTKQRIQQDWGTVKHINIKI